MADIGEVRLPDGSIIYSQCSYGAHKGLENEAIWGEFSSRVARLESDLGSEVQRLAQQLAASRGYFAPSSTDLQQTIRRLQNLAGCLAQLADDVQGNLVQARRLLEFFVSYSHQDAEFADRLTTDLRARGHVVWRDKEEIRIGESLRQRIEQGIQASSFVVVVLSQHSIESSWVNDEIDMAVAVERQMGRVVLLPVVIDKCEIPLLLQGRRWASFRDNYDRGLDDLLSHCPETGGRSRAGTIARRRS